MIAVGGFGKGDLASGDGEEEAVAGERGFLQLWIEHAHYGWVEGVLGLGAGRDLYIEEQLG